MKKKIKLDSSTCPYWTINSCKENIKNGNIGIIEYHLHKDGSWIGYPFISLKDRNEKIKELENEGYDYDKITLFEIELFKLENPTLSKEEYLQYRINYLHNLT